MKKFFLISLALVAALAAVTLAACSSTGRQATPTGAGQPSGGQPAGFVEYPIGDEVQMEGLNIAAVYFQPVEMEPKEKAGLGITEADIHLEADIHALKDNQTGFGFGEWIPYMTVKYQLKNLDNSQEQQGTFMPMNASDGPHYGANIKMMGAGKYRLAFTIESPEKQGYLLHVDEETGVPGQFWKKPIEVSWEFNYLPRKF
ncbi:MAG: iron transporter [Dehalococcoidia bacterium]|nr:iron transporter [Dehalococcoidia bacterium]